MIGKMILLGALGVSTAAGQRAAPTAQETYQRGMAECARVYQFKTQNARDGRFKSRAQLIAEAQGLRDQCEERASRQYEAWSEIERRRAARHGN